MNGAINVNGAIVFRNSFRMGASKGPAALLLLTNLAPAPILLLPLGSYTYSSVSTVLVLVLVPILIFILVPVPDGTLSWTRSGTRRVT